MPLNLAVAKLGLISAVAKSALIWPLAVGRPMRQHGRPSAATGPRQGGGPGGGAPWVLRVSICGALCSKQKWPERFRFACVCVCVCCEKIWDEHINAPRQTTTILPRPITFWFQTNADTKTHLIPRRIPFQTDADTKTHLYPKHETYKTFVLFFEER